MSEITIMKSCATSPGRSITFPHLDDNLPQNQISVASCSFNDKENDMKDTGKNSSFTFRIHDHVKMGPNLSEILKGKLSLGARIIQEGGRGNIFKNVFGMQEKEQLLKASQCYVYTTAGPIAGVLFISTQKVAFCSERPITFSSVTGELAKAPYKVLIPIGRIKEVNGSQNVNNVEQKYIEIVTEEDSEFWFLGFLRYEKALKNLNKAISMSNHNLKE
ncbi:putative GEM-like protein 8 [Vigna umbellata]|uniref:putative GEM-like protein 8 n=1 Tax=Vigna umbellata TaxID=87088 RepID=UPI001F5F6DB1|nr:putative GEM-like protein 8 [Vigna umbellata]